MFEASESVNFSAGANRWAWFGFGAVDEGEVKSVFREPWHKRYNLMAALNSLRVLRVPILFEFTVGRHLTLPRYCRHFRKFSSTVSPFCRDPQKVVIVVFEIMRQIFGKQAVVNTGDLYTDSMYEMAEFPEKDMSMIKYPPEMRLAADGSATDFYHSRRRDLLNSKLPPIMLMLSAAQSMGFVLPSLAGARVFSFL